MTPDRTTESPTLPRFVTDEARWTAVRTRDTTADGCFVYAVKTTGVYCRPSSGARLPKRENVVFFDHPQAAERAGYRPSQRATPDRTVATAQRAAVVATACRRIEEADAAADLTALADQAGLSPFHFHRVFKAETGVTPKAYAATARARRLREQLGQSGTITDAIYSAGFNASSRFYETSNALLGMTPHAYRDGGRNTEIRFAVGQCTLGALLVAQSQRGICAIFLGDNPDQLVRDLQDQFPRSRLTGGDAAFEQQVALVVGFIETPARGLNLPLDMRGTAFQERVWQALRKIPPGTTLSYTQLAERIGSPTAVRAVARACATNAIAVAIPCHRVVRRDGDLAGYRWGVERKRSLLEREAGDARPPPAPLSRNVTDTP